MKLDTSVTAALLGIVSVRRALDDGNSRLINSNNYQGILYGHVPIVTLK